MEQIPSANPLVQHDRFPARHTNPFYNPWQNTILAQEHFPRFGGDEREVGTCWVSCIKLCHYLCTRRYIDKQHHTWSRGESRRLNGINDIRVKVDRQNIMHYYNDRCCKQIQACVAHCHHSYV